MCGTKRSCHLSWKRARGTAHVLALTAIPTLSVLQQTRWHRRLVPVALHHSVSTAVANRIHQLLATATSHGIKSSHLISG